MEQVTAMDFDVKVVKASKPVIVDFYADWCGPCRRLAPVFEELSSEMSGVDFVKVNVEDAPDVAGRFGVRSIPTLVLFKDGSEVDRVMGLMPKDDLRKMIAGHL